MDVSLDSIPSFLSLIVEHPWMQYSLSIREEWVESLGSESSSLSLIDILQAIHPTRALSVNFLLIRIHGVVVGSV